MEIADRLAVMQAGRIVQVGDGETLYRSPAHPFVASFLGRVNRLLRDENARKQNIINFGGKAFNFQSQFSKHAELLIRPEDIEVGPVVLGNSHSEWGEAIVTRRHFLGDRVHLQLVLADQPELSADVGRDHPARVGDKVGVRICTERLMPCLD
jgi:putative spermidine/putrescine transport system ATP-binding protein